MISYDKHLPKELFEEILNYLKQAHADKKFTVLKRYYDNEFGADFRFGEDSEAYCISLCRLSDKAY